MVTLAQIRHDIDVTDEFYDQEQEYYDREIPVYENYVNQYKKTLYATPFRSFMEGKIGKVAFKNMELEIKGFDEEYHRAATGRTGAVYKIYEAYCKRQDRIRR